MACGIVKEKKDNRAVVIMERQDMCGDCHACEMLSGKKQCQLTCEVKSECEVGDRVEVQLGTSHFLKATYIMYGIPLLGFIGGLAVSLIIVKLLQIESTDWWLAAGMLGGTLIGAGYIKIKDKRSTYQKYLPHITSKIEK